MIGVRKARETVTAITASAQTAGRSLVAAIVLAAAALITAVVAIIVSIRKVPAHG